MELIASKPHRRHDGAQQQPEPDEHQGEDQRQDHCAVALAPGLLDERDRAVVTRFLEGSVEALLAVVPPERRPPEVAS